MINLFLISLRLSTELWDVETSFSIVTNPLLLNKNYAHGGIFLLGANECRKSGELSLLELNRPFNMKKSKSRLILMILYDTHFIYGSKEA